MVTAPQVRLYTVLALPVRVAGAQAAILERAATVLALVRATLLRALAVVAAAAETAQQEMAAAVVVASAFMGKDQMALLAD